MGSYSSVASSLYSHSSASSPLFSFILRLLPCSHSSASPSGGVVAGASFFAASAYLSFANIEPQQARAEARSEYARPEILVRNVDGKKRRKKKAQQTPIFFAEPMRASNSFVGTEEYIAPEIIIGAGHTSVVGWWALGILLYETLYGYTPFRGKTRQKTFTNVTVLDWYLLMHFRYYIRVLPLMLWQGHLEYQLTSSIMN